MQLIIRDLIYRSPLEFYQDWTAATTKEAVEKIIRDKNHISDSRGAIKN